MLMWFFWSQAVYWMAVDLTTWSVHDQQPKLNIISMAIGMVIHPVAIGIMACCCPGSLISIFNVCHNAGGQKHKRFNGAVDLAFYYDEVINRGPCTITGMQQQQVKAGERGGTVSVFPLVPMAAPSSVPDYFGSWIIIYWRHLTISVILHSFNINNWWLKRACNCQIVTIGDLTTKRNINAKLRASTYWDLFQFFSCV